MYILCGTWPTRSIPQKVEKKLVFTSQCLIYVSSCVVWSHLSHFIKTSYRTWSSLCCPYTLVFLFTLWADSSYCLQSNNGSSCCSCWLGWLVQPTQELSTDVQGQLLRRTCLVLWTFLFLATFVSKLTVNSPAVVSYLFIFQLFIDCENTQMQLILIFSVIVEEIRCVYRTDSMNLPVINRKAKTCHSFWK